MSREEGMEQGIKNVHKMVDKRTCLEYLAFERAKVMKITATQFRKNLYRYLDQVMETGVPLEITRKGKILSIVTEEKKSKFDNLKPHTIIVGDPEEIINSNWIKEWEHGKNLK